MTSTTRYVAVGDSLTQGVGDPYPDGRPRGFADLLATALGDRDGGRGAAYANLARPSVRLPEVTADQLPAAARLAPELLTVVAGVNDVIALRPDLDQLRRRVDDLLGAARAACPDALVLTATMPDLSRASALARAARRRVLALDAAIRWSASRHGVHLVDLAALPPLEPAELALDRVHPSAHGHLRIARAFGALVGCPIPEPAHMAGRPSAEALRRLYRTVAVAPRFVARRIHREGLIAGQPPKRPELLPISARSPAGARRPDVELPGRALRYAGRFSDDGL